MCLLTAVFACTVHLSAYASKETEERLKEAKEGKEQTEEAISSNEENLEGLNAVHSSLQAQLADLNTQLTQIGDNLAVLEDSIDAKIEEIRVTTEELHAAQKREEEQYAAMKRRVQFMYFRSRTLPLETILGAGSFSELLNREDYIECLSAYDRRMLELYIANKNEIADDKARLEEEQAELEDLRAQAQAEQARVSGLVSQTSGSIASYAGQIADAEAQADALKNQLAQQNKQIAALEIQLAEERRLEELSRRSVWRSIGDVQFAEGDRYLLANLIYCEAGNQPFDGQVAVGAVVMNRVLSGAFPDTIVGGIYQRGQVEPVSTGRLALALARDDATPACYAAADAAMGGQTTVADCIFFRTPIPQVTPRYVIGGHIFY